MIFLLSAVKGSCIYVRSTYEELQKQIEQALWHACHFKLSALYEQSSH